MWLACNPNQLKLKALSISKQVINIVISDVERKVKVGIAFVYGNRKTLQDQLERIVGRGYIPWIAMGDFNSVF